MSLGGCMVREKGMLSYIIKTLSLYSLSEREHLPPANILGFFVGIKKLIKIAPIAR